MANQIPNAFSVCSYNVLAEASRPQNLHHHCLASSADRYNALARRLGKMNLPVFCLQECDPAFYALLKQRLKDYEICYAQRGTKLDGCAILYKRSEFNHVFNKTISYEDGTDRRLQEVILQSKHFPDFRVTIFNTQVSEGSPVARNREFEMLAQRLQNCALPHVVCGDFALTPNDEQIQAFRLRGMHEALSYDAQPYTAISSKHGKPIRVDYVFHQRLNAKKALMLPERTGAELTRGDGPSDHLPLGIQFEIPEPFHHAPLEETRIWQLIGMIEELKAQPRSPARIQRLHDLFTEFQIDKETVKYPIYDEIGRLEGKPLNEQREFGRVHFGDSLTRVQEILLGFIVPVEPQEEPPAAKASAKEPSDEKGSPVASPRGPAQSSTLPRKTVELQKARQQDREQRASNGECPPACTFHAVSAMRYVTANFAQVRQWILEGKGRELSRMQRDIMHKGGLPFYMEVTKEHRAIVDRIMAKPHKDRTLAELRRIEQVPFVGGADPQQIKGLAYFKQHFPNLRLAKTVEHLQGVYTDTIGGDKFLKPIIDHLFSASPGKTNCVWMKGNNHESFALISNGREVIMVDTHYNKIVLTTTPKATRDAIVETLLPFINDDSEVNELYYALAVHR